MFQTLKPKPKTNGSTCLLLDTSASMTERLTTNNEGLLPRRIDVLFQVVRDTPECSGLKTYTFGSECQPLEVIPSETESLNYHPYGGTDLAGAFSTVKADGFYNAILVTDGVPDSEIDALSAAVGMKLGIIYIGNPPTPHFLQRLATATDGTFAIADMRTTGQLEDLIVRALPPPETKPEGAIKL